MMLDYFYGQSGELFSYFRIPKALFQDHRFRQLSTDARMLYGILLDCMSLSVKNDWLDEQGRVYIIYAVKIDLIPTNPADKVDRPKKNGFEGSYYSAEEPHALTESAKGEAATFQTFNLL